MTSVELKKVFPNKKVKAIIACMTSLLLSVQLYFVKGCVFFAYFSDKEDNRNEFIC